LLRVSGYLSAVIYKVGYSMIIEDLAEFASKKFGQNFLKNEIYLHKIIQSMPHDDLKVAEIGPGLGDLTKELVNNVTAFEVDKRLCEHLSSEFETPISQGRFELRCGDVLERWESGSLLDEPYHLVANLRMQHAGVFWSWCKKRLPRSLLPNRVKKASRHSLSLRRA